MLVQTGAGSSEGGGGPTGSGSGQKRGVWAQSTGASNGGIERGVAASGLRAAVGSGLARRPLGGRCSLSPDTCHARAGTAHVREHAGTLPRARVVRVAAAPVSGERSASG